MKKLLLLIFLMTISLGYSQTLRLGFESGESGNAFGPFGGFAIQPVEAGTGSNTSLVLPIIANPAGQIWQGTNFTLTTPVQLTTSKTMTIDVLSSTPVTFLMKVNGGVAGAPAAAAQASHNGDGTWQTISFTFNTALDGQAATANGVYNNMVIHPFFPFTGSASARTFYIDNIRGPQALVAPTITNFSVPTRTVGDSFQLTAPTSNSAGAFTYTSSNTSVATISGSTVTVVGAGNSTITATQAADGSYLQGTITATFTATNLIIPTINPLTLPTVTTGDAPFSITAPVSNSTGAFTYTSSNTSVATISGSTVTIVGIGSTTITATQAAAGSYDTGSVTATLTVNLSSATTPTKAAEDVISVYSNAYTDVAGTEFYPNWGQSTQFAVFSASGNPTLRYSNLNYQGNQFASPINASTMQYLHIDIWTPNCTSFQVFLINQGIGEQSVTLTPTLSGWNSFDIPLSSYTNINKANIGQFKYVGTTGSTVYLDNIYFWKAPVGTFTYYADADSDGYGAGPAVLLQSETAPTGYSVNNTDCNDSSAAINPGATEIADGLDNDCDGAIDEGFPPSTAAPTPPARNAWDVVSLFSGAYDNVTLSELPTSWSQLAVAPFTVETIAGNATWKFGGEFLGMVTNYDNGINLAQMTTMHIDYWTPDNKIMIAKIVNTIDGGEANTIVQDPVVTGTWRSVDIPMSQFGASLNKSKITQIILDPQLGGSTVYVDNLYFYRPATSLPTPTLTNFSVPAQIVGDETFTITPPTSTNNPATFTYTSSNPAVATIYRDEITIQGAGTCIITATQAASGGFGSASITASFVVSFPPPTTAAPTPTLPADRVLSIFSNAYTNEGGASYPYWGQPGAYIAPAVVEIATNNTLKLDNLTYQGVQLSSTIDVSAMTTLHLDIWSPNCTSFEFFLIDSAPVGITPAEQAVSVTLLPNQWNSIDIPMSSYNTLAKTAIQQFKFVGTPAGSTVYLDNIYFTRPESPATPATLGTFTVPAKVVGDASFELTAPTSNSNGAFTYTSSDPAVATISGSTVTIVGAGTTVITATQAASGNLGSASVTANFVVSAPTLSTAAPTPPSRNAWDVVSVYSNAYSNVTLNELPTSWSQLSEPFETVSLEGNATWRFKGQFLGMVTNYDNGIDLTSMTTMHIDYWTPDTNRIDLKLVNTVNGGEAFTALEDPTVTGTWRSIDIPLTAYGTLNTSKITQILIDPAGVSNVYIDNFYFYRPATTANAATLGTFTVPAKVVGDASFQLTAPTSNSDGAFTYTSSNPAVATISGSTVTIVGAGTTVITATQAASGNLGSASVTANFVVSFPPPTTAAPTPPARNAWDVVSVFTDAANYNVQGTDFFPYWGQPAGYIAPSIVQVGTTNDNTLLYQNLTYQGMQFNTPINVASMTKLHLDVWTPNSSTLDVVLIGGGENGVVVNPTIGEWSSFDIDMSNYAGRTLNNIIQMMFRNTTPAGGIVYVDNIYYWRPATTAPPATLGTFTVPAKVVGDASFELTAPTSNSNGAFTYTSSNPAVATISGSTVTIVGAGTTVITATQAASGNLGSASVTANFVVSGPTISTAAPTPPARNAWDVVSVFSNAYSNVTLSELPTAWSQLSEPFETVSLEGNATWRFKGQFLGMVTNYANGIDLTSMTTMHIDYWTPDSNRIDLKLVNTVNGGEAFTALEDPTVTGTWRSIDIPLTAYGTLNTSKITQILIDPAGVSNIYIDNFYFYRPATTANAATLGTFTVPAKVVGDASFELTAPTSNSDGAFTYTSSNPAVATISGSTVTIVGAGTTVITATQAASGSLGSASVTANFVVSFAPPTTAAPTPPARNAWDVVSVFTDAANYNVQGTDFFPYWGQPAGYIAPSIVQVGTTNDNTLLYQNLTYQGMQFNTPINVLSMTKLHLDVWTPNSSTLDVVLIGGGENGVVVNPTVGQWTSFDIDMSNYAGRTLNNIIQMMFRNTTPAGGIVYVDNIYYWRPATGTAFYADADADGYGSGSAVLYDPATVGVPTGYSANNTDCDDTNAAINPGATEIFDTIDNDCDGSIDEGTTLAAPGVTNSTVCVGSPSVTLTATALSGYTLRWYSAATGGTALTATPVVTTAAATVKSFWVSQRLGTGPESPRAQITVTVVALPATPGTITGTAAICVSVGTTNELTYSVAAVTGASSYQWTVPTGATIVSGQGTNTVSVNFANVSAGITPALTIGVRSVNATGCLSLAKTLALTRVLPTAPAALVMTNPASATPSTAIAAVGPFIGTTTELTLTATASATATSYTWTLPTGVNQLSGGNTNVITVNFAGVGTGITALPISVQSTNGCGNSTLKTLSLTRALPAKPAAITTTQANVCLIAGSSTNVTYTVVPVVGAFANGYTWTVPTGASIVGTATGNSIVVSYSSNFNAAGSVTVTSSNGVGTSAATALAVAATAPAAPATLVMTLAPSTTAVVAAGPYMATSTELTLTAAAVAGAVSYAWTLPAGVNQVSGGTERIITVNFADVVTPTGITALSISVKAVNGCGLQSAAKALSLTRALPAKPGVIATTRANVCAIAGTSNTVTYSVAAVPGAFASGYTWTVPTGGTIVSGQGTTSIAVSYAGDFTAGNVSVTSSNGVGTSAATTLAVARTSGAVAPAALVGQVAGLCAGTAYNYSFAAGANAQTYTITGPVGSVVTSADNASNTSNVITTSNLAFTVVYPTTAIVNISIVASNPCGSAAAKLFVVSKAMGAIATISGPTAVDTCSEYTYTASAVVGAVAYTWTIPSGAQIVSGQGTNTLVVTFPGTLATNAVLKVLATNGCSVSSALKSSSVLTRTACPTAREEVVLEEVTKTPFSVKAYPNPYTETFNLSLSTSSDDKVSVVVYDMTGRLIERRDVRPSDMVEQQIGDRYPSGVYNVVVTQGEEVKTVRVIKR